LTPQKTCTPIGVPPRFSRRPLRRSKREGMLVWILFRNTRRKLGLHATHKHLARYLMVVPRPMPAAPRRYLVVVARPLPAAVVCHRYLIVVSRSLPAAPFLVRRRYLVVVPSRCPRRRSLCVAGTCLCYPGRCPSRCLRRSDAAAAGEEHSADEQKNRVNITSFIWTEGKCPSRPCTFEE
jgi:hypothetical protein